MKLTFLSFDEELVIEEALEDPRNMLNVRLLSGGEDQDIVQIHKNKLVEPIPENVIHQGLKTADRVTKYS